MSKELWKRNLSSKSIWVRILLMILFGLLANIVKMLVGIIVLFQLVHVIIMDKPNSKLLQFNQDLATYLSHIVLYLGFNTETKPFPFANWGSMDVDEK